MSTDTNHVAVAWLEMVSFATFNGLGVLPHDPCLTGALSEHSAILNCYLLSPIAIRYLQLPSAFLHGPPLPSIALHLPSMALLGHSAHVLIMFCLRVLLPIGEKNKSKAVQKGMGIGRWISRWEGNIVQNPIWVGCVLFCTP